MRWPHPCFLLLRGINNSYRGAFTHQTQTQRALNLNNPRRRIPYAALHVSRYRMDHNQDVGAPSSSNNKKSSSATRLDATTGRKGETTGAINSAMLDRMVATDVPSIPLSVASMKQQAKGNGKNMMDGSSDQEQEQQPMDISVPGSDVQMDINSTTAAARNNGTQSPLLKSVMEETQTNSTESDTEAPAPLLHEHHRTLSTKSTSDTFNDEDDDVEMSSTWQKALIQRPSLAGMGPCKSIEEASVNTTIESVTMKEAYKGDNDEVDLMWDDGQDDVIMPSASSDTAYYTAQEGQQELLITETFETAQEGDVAEPPKAPSSPSAHHNVKLRLTHEEETLFQLLVEAAEAYEAGQLCIDPNPTQQSVSARGGFTKQDSTAGNNTTTTEEGASWLKLPPKVDRIEIRVAGGWVRDKLLNQHSCDVDVALDCMMGVQFARIVQSYMAREDEKKEKERDALAAVMNALGNDTGEKQQGKVKSGSPGRGSSKANRHQQNPPGSKAAKKQKEKSKQPKIGVIGANPSQSKHLETATMNIHGIDVDFVNLRAEEVYEQNSRIPTSKTRMFGSPLEDALRRDFTINSLFYNIRTRRVEDWTGRGLDDLMIHRRIVTPVNANETFHDDPLRVLRAIRFCVRLDFTLDEQIKQAAMSKRVHHSLHVKVSRERVGKELEGMLTGKHARPARALDMIADLHLAGSVFAFPGSFPGDHDYAGGPVTGHILGIEYNCTVGTDCPEKIEMGARHRARGWEESSKLLGVLPMVMEGHVDEKERVMREQSGKEDVAEGSSDAVVVSSSPSATTTVDMRLLHLCVFILPFHNLTFPDKKGREVAVTAQMVKEALKFPVRDIRAVSDILSHVDEMAEILSEIRGQLEEAAQQSQHRTLPEDVRITPLCRLRLGLLLRSLKENWVTCLLTAAAWEIRLYQRRCLDVEARADDGTATQTMSIPSEQPSREFYRAVVDDLDLDECWRVKPHFNGKEIIKELSLPKGPLVGVYIEDQTRWMLLNPDGTREECMTHLQQRKREREAEQMAIDDQNEANVGVANGDGHPSPVVESKDDGEKHFSKKIRAEN